MSYQKITILFVAIFLSTILTSCLNDKFTEEIPVKEEEVIRNEDVFRTFKNVTLFVVDNDKLFVVSTASDYAMGSNHSEGRSISISVSLDENTSFMEGYLKNQFGDDIKITYKKLSLERIKSIKRVDVICDTDFNDIYKKGNSLNDNLRLDYIGPDGKYYSTMELNDFNSGGTNIDWYQNNKVNRMACRMWTKTVLPYKYGINYVKNINDEKSFMGFESTVKITFADGSSIETRPFPTIAF